MIFFFTGTRLFWTVCSMTACLYTFLGVIISHCYAYNYLYLCKTGVWLSNSTGQCSSPTVPCVKKTPKTTTNEKRDMEAEEVWVGTWSAKDQHSNTWVLFPALPQTLDLTLSMSLKLRFAQRFGPTFGPLKHRFAQRFYASLISGAWRKSRLYVIQKARGLEW